MALRFVLAALVFVPCVLAARDVMELHVSLAEDDAGATRSTRAHADDTKAEPVSTEAHAGAAGAAGAASSAAQLSAAASGIPGLDVLSKGADAFKSTLKAAIVAYAATHSGVCPSADAVPDLPGWDSGYQDGAGCAVEGGHLCKCARSPFYSCATGSRFGAGQVADSMTSTYVSTFGYCRVSTWVFVAIVGTVLGAITLLVCCVSGKRKSTGMDMDY